MMSTRGEGSGKRRVQSASTTKVVKWWQMVPSASVTAIKRRNILAPFEAFFGQFPIKIRELQALVADPRYDPLREDIVTNLSMFSVPPSLQQMEKDKWRHVHSARSCCNFNRQTPIMLSYDGFIPANRHLVELATLLESYSEFYERWSGQFLNALALLKPPIMEEDNLSSELSDTIASCVCECVDLINGMINTSDICASRADAIGKLQASPHLADFRTNLVLCERQSWFALCYNLHRLSYCYQMNYDFMAKNCLKLIRALAD